MSNRRSVILHYQKAVETLVQSPQRAGTSECDDRICHGCENYEPYFKYRKCLYPVCLKGVAENVFLNKPLKEDLLVVKGFTPASRRYRTGEKG